MAESKELQETRAKLKRLTEARDYHKRLYLQGRNNTDVAIRLEFNKLIRSARTRIRRLEKKE